MVLPFLLALHQSCMHACDFFHVPAASPPIFPERYSWALLRLSSYINLRVFLPSLVPFQAISLSFPSTFLQEFHVASSKFSWHCHSFSMRFTTSRVSCYISFSLAMRFPILFLLWFLLLLLLMRVSSCVRSVRFPSLLTMRSQCVLNEFGSHYHNPLF